VKGLKQISENGGTFEEQQPGGSTKGPAGTDPHGYANPNTTVSPRGGKGGGRRDLTASWEGGPGSGGKVEKGLKNMVRREKSPQQHQNGAIGGGGTRTSGSQPNLRFVELEREKGTT